MLKDVPVLVWPCNSDYRLKDVSKSRIIILLTDGVNNAGVITQVWLPIWLKNMVLSIHFGIGTNGNAEFPYAKTADGKFLYKMQR